MVYAPCSHWRWTLHSSSYESCATKWQSLLLLPAHERKHQYISRWMCMSLRQSNFTGCNHAMCNMTGMIEKPLNQVQCVGGNRQNIKSWDSHRNTSSFTLVDTPVQEIIQLLNSVRSCNHSEMMVDWRF